MFGPDTGHIPRDRITNGFINTIYLHFCLKIKCQRFDDGKSHTVLCSYRLGGQTPKKEINIRSRVLRVVIMFPDSSLGDFGVVREGSQTG